jgi:hypothetical protein
MSWVKNQEEIEKKEIKKDLMNVKKKEKLEMMRLAQSIFLNNYKKEQEESSRKKTQAER